MTGSGPVKLLFTDLVGSSELFARPVGVTE